MRMLPTIRLALAVVFALWSSALRCELNDVHVALREKQEEFMRAYQYELSLPEAEQQKLDISPEDSEGDNLIQSHHAEFLHSVQFIDAKRGCAIDWNGKFHKTVDGGLNWRETTIVEPSWLARKIDPEGGVLRAMHFSDANFGLAVGPVGLLQTTDGGQTWTRSISPSLLQLPLSTFCLQDRTCWIGTSGSRVIWERRAYGSQPIRHSTPARGAVTAIQFVGAAKGWAVTSKGEIIGTQDSGATWRLLHRMADIHLYSLYFVNDRQGWVVGSDGAVLHTSDGGSNWQSQTLILPPEVPRREIRLHAVKFMNEQKGWVAGLHGVVYKTENGGADWLVSRFVGLAKTNWLTAYALDITKSDSDEEIVWIAGNAGNIFASIAGNSMWIAVHGIARVSQERWIRARSGQFRK